MKNAKLQTEDSETNKEEMKLVDYNDELQTNPLQPPPDVFMKLRLSSKDKKLLHNLD